MIKVNQRYLAAIISLISLLNIADSKNLFATADYILGRVIYSDNSSPLTEGYIKVYNTSSKSAVVIESASINLDGEFHLSGSSVQLTDEIKIMAYPNDPLDNMEGIPVDPYVIAVENSLSDPEAKYSLIIKVERKQNESNNKEKKYGGILLKQNFPNPFNPTTLISFDLPNTAKVSLKIYNMRGESIATLIDNKILSKGTNEIKFNAESLPSGIYIYSLKAGEYNLNRKMSLIK